VCDQINAKGEIPHTLMQQRGKVCDQINAKLNSAYPNSCIRVCDLGYLIISCGKYFDEIMLDLGFDCK
jgi:hypothetical protein